MGIVAGTGRARRPVHGVRRLLIAARVIHPFPTAANVLAVGLFALIAARQQLDGAVLVRLLLTMLGVQSAIGAANDASDVDLDRAGKPWKPIVAGAISRRGAWLVAILGAGGACALAATLGIGAWALAMLGLCCGLAYDLGLKRSPLSVITYLIALPLLPLWVWVALGRFTVALLWVYPLGMLVGMSLYLGNTAPDIEADLVAGVSGLAHRLGLRRALTGAWLSMGAALVLGSVLAPFAGYDSRLVLPAAGLSAVLLGVAMVLSLGGGRPALQRAWSLLIVASLLFALGWLAAAPRAG